MNSLHPGPDAGDGRVIEQSHFIKRSDKLDNVIWCAQCGFPVDLTKRPTGPSLGAIGSPTLSTDTVSPPKPGISYTESFGDPVDTNSGCPLCNSMNPRAIGRGKNGFDSQRMSIENL